MRNVSTAFRNELNKDNRRYIKTCDITLVDGAILHIKDAQIWNGGFKIDDAVSNDNSFDIGSAIIGKFTLILNNIYDEFSDYDFTGAEVSNIKTGLKLPDGTVESVKCGVFTVDEPKYNGSIITLECLDNMSKFDRSYSESNLTFPATLGAIVRDACSCCDVSLAADSADFEYSDFIVDVRPDDRSLTFRQVLSWIGQISCHWCRCNVNGQLSLGWYAQALFEKNKQVYDGGFFEPWTGGDTLDGGTMNPWTEGENVDGGSFDEMKSFHHIFSMSSMNICTDDVVITGIRVMEETPEDSEEDEIIYQAGKDGYVLTIDSNKLIQNGKGAEVAAYLGNKLIGLQFRPLDVSCLSDPSIEAGDIAFVTDRKGRSYAALITNTTFSAGNYQQVSCGAETPARNSSGRVSEATRVYQELRRKLKKDKTEWVKAMEALDKRLETSSGLYSTVETLEDDSRIYYMHDKPTLAESQIVWKMTAEAWGVSTDGGKTWNGGMTVDGEMITRILNTIGLNADWINAGALVVKDSEGNILFNADIDTGRVDIIADSLSIRGKTVEELAQQELNDFVSSVFNDAIIDLQSQIDGQIETYYYDYEPTLGNEPASLWVETLDKQKHEGDLFYWKSKGFAYRFMKDGTAWKWQLVQDTDITKALETASKAQDTADNKRRVFIATPIPPYDAGDMWVTSTENGKAAVKICKTARNSGVFSSTDWIDPKYVDGDDVNQAIGEFDTSLGQPEIFNKLTNGGKNKGIYIDNGELYINASYILAGVLAGKFINAKGINVKDNYGNTTFYIDDNGNVTIRATTFSLSGKSLNTLIGETVDSKIGEIDLNLTQKEIFDILTNNGQTQGIYLSGGKVYINASYIDTGNLAGWTVGQSSLSCNVNGNKVILDAATSTVYVEGSTSVYDGYTGTARYGTNIRGHEVIGCIADFFSINVSTLDVSRGVLYLSPSTASAGSTLVVDSSGMVKKMSGSSKRYKNFSRDMELKDVEKLYDLPIIYFQYKNGYLGEDDLFSHEDIPGFYAEDIQKCFPKAVRYIREKDVTYPNQLSVSEKLIPDDWEERYLIPGMLKLIQEQKKQLDLQEERITRLERMIGGDAFGN